MTSAVDRLIRDLRWFFNDSDTWAQLLFALFQRPIWENAGEKDIRLTHGTARRRLKIRAALLALPQPHADVLAWAMRRSIHPPKVRSVVGEYPAVALRTDAARRALAKDEGVERAGDYRHLAPGAEALGGMEAFVAEAGAGSALVAAIRSEAVTRVGKALGAFEGAMG